MLPRCGAGCSGLDAHEADMSDDDETAAQPEDTDEAAHHGRHELAPHQPQPAIGELQPRGFLGMPRRGRTVFGTLAVVLCLLLGVAIATQVRQTSTGDSLDTARPADLLVLLDSLRQREATLNTEVAELERSLNALKASGSNDQAAIQNAQARLAALSILIGTVGASGPGVTVRIEDPCSTSCAPREPRRSRSATSTRRYASVSILGSSAPLVR
jgi:hypothetical protein